MIVCKEFTFDSAHNLIKDPGKCANLHGHTYKLQVCIEGHINNDTGYILNFSEINKIVKDKIINKLDHKYLNEIIDTPSAENISKWIWDNLINMLPQLSEIKLWESPSNFCIYRGEN